MRDASQDSWSNSLEDPEAMESRQRRERLLVLLRGRWHWGVLLGTVLGAGLGYLAYNSQDDLYEAKSGITMYSHRDMVSTPDDPLREQYQAYVDTEVRKMKSEVVVRRAMETREWQEHLATRPSDASEITPEAFQNALEIWPPSNRNSLYVSVAFTDKHPDTASAAVNSIMLAYKQFREGADRDDQKIDRDVLLGQLQDQKNTETQLRNEIAAILPESGLVTMQTRLQQKLNTLNIREQELKAIDLQLAPLIDKNGEPTERLRQEMVATDPRMAELLAYKEQLEQNLRMLKQIRQLGDSHRDVQATRRSLSMMDRDIAELEAANAAGEVVFEMPVGVVDLLTRRQNLLALVDELNASITDLSTKMSRVDRVTTELEGVLAQIQATKTKITEYDARTIEIDTADRSRIELGPFQLPPTSPSNKSKRQQLAALGGASGMSLGFGFVMLLGLMDRKMRYVSDAAVGMPYVNVLGILPTLPQNLQEPEDAEAAAHCVHHIRTLLQIGGTNRVFSITSPTTGAGKSSLSSALGMSFASSGAKTLVIDCDLVGAGLSRRLGVVVHQPLDVVIRIHRLLDDETLDRAMMLSSTRGRPLDEVLMDQGMMTEDEIERAARLQRDTSMGVLDACTPGRLRSCVAGTDLSNFFVLPVGKAKPADASKLSPTAVRSLIQQAREDYDMVLIDTGPALGSLEASIAAAEADATVLIVSRGDEKSVTRRCVELLESVHANIAGVVFNHALERDVSHASYASVVSQDRRPDRATRKSMVADLKRNARFGPLGSAVAAYHEQDPVTPEKVASATTNGHHAED